MSMKLKEKIMNLSCINKYKMWLSRLLKTRIGWIIRQLCRIFQCHSFVAQIVMILAYRVALDILYITVLSPYYAYAGHTTKLALPEYLCSWAALLIMVPCLAQLNRKKTSSSLLVTVINYLYFVPLTSYFGCKGMNITFFIIAYCYWGLLLFWQFVLPVLHLEKSNHKMTNGPVYAATGAACLFVLFISGKYTGFRFTLNFLDVYDIRAEAASYQMPAMFSYGLSMMPLILTTLLLFWMQKKRYIVAIGIVITYLFLFSIAAHKTVFLFLFLALGSYFLYRGWMWKGLPTLLAGAAGVAVLENKIIGTFYLTSLVFRRMMYIPVHLSEQSYIFYQDHPVNLFRDGIMGKFSFDNLYSVGIPRLLGEAMGNPQTNANNGMLGDMVTHLPIFLGLLLMPLILVICFRLLDMAANQTDGKILLPFCVWFANGFINGPWSTVLLSNGFLITCLLLYIFPRKDVELK